MINYNNSKYVNANCPFAILDFSNLIFNYISSHIDPYQQLVILCIGTDRSTGDSLGPLVGYKLEPYLTYYDQVHLLGTLNKPVHAKNLTSFIDKVNSKHPEALIVAIDASLGNLNRIGYINIKKGPLKPGLGVNKELPIVGDISITGVVNVGGMMEYMVLQNTRLSLVMNMADIISKGIYRAVSKIYKDNINKGIKKI